MSCCTVCYPSPQPCGLLTLSGLKPVDIEFMRRLSPFTNVLPIIAKSDTLTAQQITSLKLSILGELRSANVRPFLFGKSSSDILRSAADHDEDDKDHPTPPITAPFAISSVFSEDAENMDASVLMSSDYIPPLLDTELKLLVDQVFDPDNIAWLKHTVAKKFLGWQRASSTTSLIQLNPNQHHRPNTPPRSPSTRRCSPAPESFALARVADHTLREERLAKVRLSRWANELQKSLAAERERYERLARGERAVWLTERLGECISDGQLVAVRSAGGRRSRSTGEEGGVDTRDPFGILLMNETVGRKVLVMIKIAGLGGLVGVVSVWMYKQWGVQGWSEVLGEVRR